MLRSAWTLSLLYSLLFPVGFGQRTPSDGTGFRIKAHGTGVRYASTGQSMATNIGVSTDDGAFYTVDIVLGGKEFTVQLDTGSTDLWVDARGTPLKLTNTTSVSVSETYGKGVAQGTLSFAELQLGPYTIPSQDIVFVNAESVKDFGNDQLGIMGIAFDNANIHQTIRNAYGPESADTLGRAPMTNIFAQNPASPNFFDVQLGRTSDLDDINNGTFTISNHMAGYEDVAEAPKLYRVQEGHWSVLLDSMKINGKPFTFNDSSVTGVPAGKTVAVLDTGFSWPPLPPAAIDAIYGSIPGAVFDTKENLWIVPCLSGTNLTFVFAGQEFNVHPLDLTTPVSLPIPINGTDTNVTICINTYQYLDLDPTTFQGFDMILGDSFLRNVYASFDYGDYDPYNGTDGVPFVQMLSTTDLEGSWEEFRVARAEVLAELPPTLDPAVVVQIDLATSANYTDGSSSDKSNTNDLLTSGAVDTSSDSGDSNLSSLVKQYGLIMIGLLAGNLLVGILLFAIGLTLCLRGVVRSGAKSRSIGSTYAPVRVKDNVDSSTDPENQRSYHD